MVQNLLRSNSFVNQGVSMGKYLEVFKYHSAFLHNPKRSQETLK